MKKAITLLAIGTFLFVSSGCTSTMVLGSKANAEKNLDASADLNHVGLTLPFVKVGAKMHKSD
jgi:hypothetical protein